MPCNGHRIAHKRRKRQRWTCLCSSKQKRFRGLLRGQLRSSGSMGKRGHLPPRSQEGEASSRRKLNLRHFRQGVDWWRRNRAPLLKQGKRQYSMRIPRRGFEVADKKDGVPVSQVP